MISQHGELFITDNYINFILTILLILCKQKSCKSALTSVATFKRAFTIFTWSLTQFLQAP